MGHSHRWHVVVGWLLVAGAVGSAGAVPLSNQEFSAQVRAWRGQLAAAESVVGQAALLCTNLPAHRAVEEPQCVALRLHLRAQRQAQAPGQSTPQPRQGVAVETLSGCARSALSGVLGSLSVVVGPAA